MHRAGRQSHQEIDILLLDRLAFQPEILFESHAARHENQISRAHPDRSGGDRRDAKISATGENLGTHVQHEEVEPVNEQIYAVQEIVDVVIVDAIGETPDFSGRVDIPHHAGHHIDLGLAERTDGSAELTVEVDRLEDIHIRDMERPDAKTGQRQQMSSADAAHTGDGHPFDAQYLLLPLGDPSNVATERLVIIEVEAARRHRQDGHGRQVPLVFGSSVDISLRLRWRGVPAAPVRQPDGLRAQWFHWRFCNHRHCSTATGSHRR